MFVFRSEDLPADPTFPADLQQLGCVNSQHNT
jgi:hypothetical protein